MNDIHITHGVRWPVALLVVLLLVADWLLFAICLHVYDIKVGLRPVATQPTTQPAEAPHEPR